MNNLLLLDFTKKRRPLAQELAMMHLPVIMQALCYCANDEECPFQELAMALHGEISRAQREERA